MTPLLAIAAYDCACGHCRVELARAWEDEQGVHVALIAEGSIQQELAIINGDVIEWVEETVSRCPAGDHEIGTAAEWESSHIDRIDGRTYTVTDAGWDGCEVCARWHEAQREREVA